MPRSNRPRGGRPDFDEPEDLSYLLAGWRRTEVRRGRSWTVQPIAAPSATKAYRCPGCVVEISPGTAHIVAWPADGPMGESGALDSRRHWHTHCWKVS
ncbi:MAG TPA: hypothetical protein VK139_06165 [Microbacteriaceae bacterium]|nr:hypothetical protein [Microbacteriaceae bacterium]